jgi:4-hydroxybenzoate polyprenyltransferase
MALFPKMQSALRHFENQPINLTRWVILFSAIILLRIFEEDLLELNNPQTVNFIWHDFLHIFLIFLFINVLGYTILRKTLNLKFQAFLNVSLIGALFLALIPPLLNYFFALKYKMLDFYEFYSSSELLINFFTFLHQDPFIGVLPGQRITILISLLAVGLYSFLKKAKISTILINVFLFYLIFYIVSTLPSIIALLIYGLDLSAVNVSTLFFSPTDLFNQNAISIDLTLHKKMIFSYVIIFTILTPILLWKNKIFKALIQNIRPIQVVYHLALLISGIGIALFFTEAYLLFNFFNILALLIMFLIIIFIWFSSVIINDYFDENIDKISNKNRPLITNIINKKTYLQLAIFLIIISLILSILINPSITILICFYYVLTLIYNTPPLRLKKIPIIATFISALASLVIIFIGYILIVPENNLTNFPSNIIYFTLISLTLSFPLKDLKDIQGDKLNKIYTLPVIFGEKKSRLIIGVNIFISFLLSVFVLRVGEMFIPALIFGLISFSLLNFKKNNAFLISPKNVIPLIFSLVFIYGIYFVVNIF